MFQEFFYGPGAGGREFKQFGEGAGSGVFISSMGYIVTNNHVIDNASEIQVILNDNSKYDAKVIGTDPSTDLAVIKIEGENFDFVKNKRLSFVFTLGNKKQLRDTLGLPSTPFFLGNLNFKYRVWQGFISYSRGSINATDILLYGTNPRSNLLFSISNQYQFCLLYTSPSPRD